MLTSGGSLGDYVITCYDVIATIKAHDRCGLVPVVRPLVVSQLSDPSGLSPCDRQFTESVVRSHWGLTTDYVN